MTLDKHQKNDLSDIWELTVYITLYNYYVKLRVGMSVVQIHHTFILLPHRPWGGSIGSEQWPIVTVFPVYICIHTYSTVTVYTQPGYVIYQPCYVIYQPCYVW